MQIQDPGIVIDIWFSYTVDFRQQVKIIYFLNEWNTF